MAEKQQPDREIEQRLAALEADIADAAAGAQRWRRAELLGSVKRESEYSSGIGGLNFVLGVGLTLFGLYAFFSNVVVTSGLLAMLGFGPSGFGWSLLVLLGGVALIVVRPRAVWGWAVGALAVGFIFFEVLGTLRIYFRPVTLTGLIIMLLPLALGVGLILRSVASALRRP